VYEANELSMDMRGSHMDGLNMSTPSDLSPSDGASLSL
jgi:hypothetical protein